VNETVTNDLAAPVTHRLADYGPQLLTAAAVCLWVLSLRTVNLDAVSDVGLVTALGPRTFLAFASLVGAFCWALAAQVIRPGLLLAQVLVLLVMLHGIAGAVEPVPRFVTAWLHAGFVDYIARTGETLIAQDARFNWPGFFALAAMVTRIAGQDGATWLLRWAPVCFNLLYLISFHVIVSTVFKTNRVRWLALWLFVMANWIGQDYFSPQAFGYFLFLVIVAIVLRYFDRESAVVTTAGQRAGLVVAILLMFCAIVVSHPLTPFFVIAATGLLAVTRRTRLVSLPLVLAVILVAWMSWGAQAYWSGNLDELVGQIGNVNRAIEAGLIKRIEGSSAGRLIVQIDRIGLTVLIGLLAAIGLARQRPREHAHRNTALLAITPFCFLALQSYGGEMLLRTFFFALPFLAMLGALAFFPNHVGEHGTPAACIAVGILSALLVPSFLIARYGNERFERITPNELAAMEFIYEHAAPGSAIVTVVPFNALWRYQDLEQYTYRPLEKEPDVLDDVGAIQELMSSTPERDYLAVTEGQGAYVEAALGQRPGWAQRLIMRVKQSGHFQVVYENPGATVFVLDEASASGSTKG
jgi:hypothetical protein